MRPTSAWLAARKSTGKNRAHFFAVAGQLMRRVLVDHARKRNAAKRGSRNVTLLLEEFEELPAGREVDLVSLDYALKELARLDPEQSQIVELRFFAGLSICETVDVLGLTRATVQRHWATARVWLHHELSGSVHP